MNFMDEIDQALVNTRLGDFAVDTTFHATLNARGCYEGLRFVVRLSPRVHDLISTLPTGIGFSSSVTFEQMQAFSTYLHETIHWWQHIGSTAGFLMSLSHPAQTHANLKPLLRLLELVGPVKSIYQLAASQSDPSTPDTPAGLANTVINNQFDIEAYRSLVTNPERADQLIHSPLFENMGHAYRIAQANGVLILGSTFDRELALLPDPREWIDEYHRLGEIKEPGFFYGSPVTLSPIGAKYIFEGQARFSQLQYLHFGTGGRFDWDDAADAGMLLPLYCSAFDAFLAASKLARPSSLNHPVVGLFLLVCDIAMNPGEGFPYPVWSPPSFISDNDIGLRFLHLAAAVRLFCPEVATAITTYSAGEYASVCEKLCTSLKIFSPIDNCRAVARFVEEGSAFRDCLALHDVGKASLLNMPIQLMFGQFASYARDKLRHPEILCWPGPAMAGKFMRDTSAGVFSRQSPLFIDRADSEMIVPVVRQGLNEADVIETFQNFYNGQALYDMTRQWIRVPGPFTYDYRWLQPNGSHEQSKHWAEEGFKSTFGVEPDAFRLLPS